MINKPPQFKGLTIRIPTITPITGKGFINQGSGLVFGASKNHLWVMLLIDFDFTSC